MSIYSLPVVSILTGSEEPVQPSSAQPFSSKTSFQSSPAPKSRCNTKTGLHLGCPIRFQSSPAPKSRCNSVGHKQRHIQPVSILTGSEEPVQRGCVGYSASLTVFQSSPAPKSRCNAGGHVLEDPGRSFNPHRLRRAGATGTALEEVDVVRVSILTGSEEPVQRVGVIQYPVAGAVSILTGSEEPVQRIDYISKYKRLVVSILTGPEEPVQRHSA